VAITHDQLVRLHRYARAAALTLAPDADDHHVLTTVFEDAAHDGMRILDEFDAPVTLEDLPVDEDRSDLIAAFHDEHQSLRAA
jgi:hypothetical protein